MTPQQVWQAMAKMVMLMGGFLVLVGGLMWALSRLPEGLHLRPLLPGDILIRRGNFTFFFPLATCLLISAGLTLLFLLLSLLRR